MKPRQIELVTVDTQTLVGAALDYAVAVVAQKREVSFGWSNRFTTPYAVVGGTGRFPVSEDWALLGPLLVQFNVWPHPTNWNGSEHTRFCARDGLMQKPTCYGPTALIAACRCIVGMVNGEKTTVPLDLVDYPARDTHLVSLPMSDTQYALLNQVASDEGWLLTLVNNDRYMIERDDEMAMFATDEDAEAFVRKQADNGSLAHRLALMAHAQPKEVVHQEFVPVQSASA